MSEPNPHGLVWFPGKICVANRDGTTWEPSHSGHPTMWMGFYFRRIRKIRWGLWRRTGETWRFPGGLENHRKFEVRSWKDFTKK